MTTLSQADYEEVLQMRREFAVLRSEWRCTVRDYFARKFDPEQPRVPAGSQGGGQWTNGTGDVTGSTGLQPARYLLATAGAASVAYCMNQNTIDMLYCSTLQPAWYRAACRSHANERLAACLTGKPLPPLPF